MHQHMTSEELEALFNAPSATVGPEADVVQPAPPQEPRPQPKPHVDPSAATQDLAYERYVQDLALAKLQAQNEAAYEARRHQLEMRLLEAEARGLGGSTQPVPYRQPVGPWVFIGFAAGALIGVSLCAWAMRDKTA